MIQKKSDLFSFTVESEEAASRIDVFLTRKFSQHGDVEDFGVEGLETCALSRSKLQKLFKEGKVFLNDLVAKASEVVKGGDIVRLPVPMDLLQKPLVLEPVSMKLAILFEDDHVIVLNKPEGVVVHPGAGETGPTLVQGILHHLGRGSTQVLRPGIVHRLDKDTTGVLVCAKNERSHLELSKQFAEKSAGREYIALLDGFMKEAQKIHESYLFRDPKCRLKFSSITTSEFELRSQTKRRPQGVENLNILKGYRYSKSLFARLHTYGSRLTLARIKLFTGRTHQIRIHANDLKMPVLGDQTYNKSHELPHHFKADVRSMCLALSRQMLHAERLEFSHPITGEHMEFSAPRPNDFDILLKLLEPYKDKS